MALQRLCAVQAGLCKEAPQVQSYVQKERYTVNDLLDIVRLLREPGGCPWDREQTSKTICKNFIEEAYEAVDAIEQNDMGLLCEELGDVLLQVVLHAQIKREEAAFSFEDVCDGLCRKLIYRHPHVFLQEEANSSQQALQSWEKLKNAEKGRDSAATRLDSVPLAFPAAMRAQKTQKRAADYGFCYDDANAAMQDLKAEMDELQEAMQASKGMKEEIGDVLFSAVNVARMLDIDAEEALQDSTKKFARRVKAVEQMANDSGKTLADASAQMLERWWSEAKNKE